MPDGVGDRTAEEAEEGVRDRRGEDREGRQEGGLRRPVGHERQGDERDRVAEAADRLTHPKKREIRRSELMSLARRGGRLKPHEGDQEAAEADEEVAEAKDRADYGDRDHIREELELRR